MKTTTLVTTPVNRLKKLIGLTPQVLTVGCRVEVYNGITGKISFSGIVEGLYKDKDYICGNIKDDKGVLHDSNTLGTTKLVC